jgi:hypothetical protein
MTGETIQRLEVGLDAAAAILLGAATAFVLLRFDASNGYAVTGAGIVFAWALYGLRSVEHELAAHRLPQFEASDLRFKESGELLLDDALADAGPDSRVVRLFDRTAMPASPDGDASQALYDALAKLRRSLR